MNPKHFLTRILPAATVTAGLLFAAPAADAAGKKKPVTATIALGDKRPKRAHAAVAPCQNTDVLPSAEQPRGRPRRDPLPAQRDPRRARASRS